MVLFRVQSGRLLDNKDSVLPMSHTPWTSTNTEPALSGLPQQRQPQRENFGNGHAPAAPPSRIPPAKTAGSQSILKALKDLIPPEVWEQVNRSLTLCDAQEAHDTGAANL